MLETARKRGVFPRAAKAAGIDGTVLVPADLAARTEVALAGRIADLLGMARRAGQAVCGHERVTEWIASGRVGLLVQASDGAPAARARLLGRAGGVPGVAPLPAAALGQVFGRDHAVHVGIARGRLAGLIENDCRRLAGFVAAGETGTDTE